VKATKQPGVKQISRGVFQIRAEYECPKTGKLKTIRRRVEAANALEAANLRDSLVRQARVADSKPDRLKLRDYVTSWMAGKLETLAASTADRYVNELENHIIPAFGDYWVDAITRQDIIGWRNEQTGKPASVNSVLRTMRLVIRDATRELGIADPTLGVSAVRAEQGDDDAEEGGRILTLEEVVLLLDAAARVVPQWYPLIRLLAVTGLRFSEATALKWGDIDLDAGDLTVRRAQVRGQVGKPKTRKSRRRLPIEANTVALLRVRRAAVRGDPGDWVFPSETGGLLFNGVLTKPLRKAAVEAGLAVSPSPHWFRRSLNRLLAQQSSERVQMAMLGHVTDRMRLHYDHVLLDEKRDAVGRVFGQKPDFSPDTGAETDESNLGGRDGNCS